ncbi:Ceramide glucosyltransferase, partial [Coemansia sp. BCRC 34490]
MVVAIVHSGHDAGSLNVSGDAAMLPPPSLFKGVIDNTSSIAASLGNGGLGIDSAAYFVLVLASIQWLLIIISHCVLQRRYVKPRPFVSRPSEHYPRVTIIRPMKGVDMDMCQTLESSFQQTYPSDIEILFAVEDPEDPAIDIANKLIKKYPKIQAHVLIGQDNVGTNPKINNMIKAFARAQNDLLWI